MPTPTSSSAPWARYGRILLRRLRQAESARASEFDLDATEGDVIAPPERGATPSAIELLDELEASQLRDAGELDALREAGADGWALDATGSDQPAHIIAPDRILMALRLAATFTTEERFLADGLRPRALTVLDGVEPHALDGAAKTIGRLMLPQGWSAQLRAPHGGATKVLQVIRPYEIGTNRLPDHAYARAESEIVTALALPHPVMVLLPAGAPLSASLRRVLPPALTLAPIDREILLALLAQTHSATGKIDRAP
ncbi:hypothetical protein OCH239_22330, partial [Roseivivax halodurans JCM 10272]